MNDETELRKILEEMLFSDIDITARAVIRLHPSIKAASSITRISARRELMESYQKRQMEFRTLRNTAGKMSNAKLTDALEKKNRRIEELEQMVKLMAGSHLAAIRTVGEMGGFQKWVSFFKDFKTAQRTLGEIGALDTESFSNTGKFE